MRAAAPVSSKRPCYNTPVSRGGAGAIYDPATRRPLSLYGRHEAPQPFTVGARPTALNDSQTAVGQLMTLDVEWD